MHRLERLVRILLAAEAASADRAATIDFCSKGQGDLIGRVAADRGRVCWAVARSQRLRVSDIFAEEMHVSRELLEEVFRNAKDSGRPFGEALVERGLVDEKQLRSSLRRQVVAALTALSEDWGDGDDTSWHAEEFQGRAYDPSFTETSLGLLMACIQEGDGLQVEAFLPPQAFLDMARQAGAAVYFLQTNLSELPLIPVCASNVTAMSLSSTIALGRHALAAVRPAALRAASVEPFAILAHEDGEGLVCALEGRHVYVFEVRERSEYGALLAHLAAMTGR